MYTLSIFSLSRSSNNNEPGSSSSSPSSSLLDSTAAAAAAAAASTAGSEASTMAFAIVTNCPTLTASALAEEGSSPAASIAAAASCWPTSAPSEFFRALRRCANAALMTARSSLSSLARGRRSSGLFNLNRTSAESTLGFGKKHLAGIPKSTSGSEK